MNRYWIIMFSFLVSNACQSNINNQIIGQSSNSTGTIEYVKNGTPSIIEGSIGIITTTNRYKFGDTIFVFNKQKLPFTTIVITNEYQELDLKCFMITDDLYKVQVNDSISGYLIKSNPLIKFQTWEEHVLSVFCVDFNGEINPLRDKPNKQSSVINYEPNEYYFPQKIQGDWLQVRWGREGKWQYGWIIWKKDGKLLIELFYFA